MLSQALRDKYKFKKSLKDIKSEYILAAGKFNHYLACSSPDEIIQISQTYGNQNCIGEVNQNLKYINCFFDFDCKQHQLDITQQEVIKKDLKSLILQKIHNVKVYFYVKDASRIVAPNAVRGTFEKSTSKIEEPAMTSLHFILRLYTRENQPIYFRSKTQIDQFFKFLNLQKPFDIDAHKGFCLRTLYSDKFGNDNKLQQRPFKKSEISDQTGDLQSLVCYCPNAKDSMYIDDYIKKDYMLMFVKELQFEKDYDYDDIKKRDQDNHLSLQLTEKKCHNREHNSNNCCCMLFNDRIVVKCHDETCKSLVQPLNIGQFEILKLEQSVQTPCDKLKLSKEQENVMNAHNEIAQTKEKTGSDVDQITQLEKGGFKALIKYPEFSGLDQELRQLLGNNGIVQHTLSNGQTIEFAQSSKLQQALQRLDKTYDHDEIKNIVQVYNQYNININVQQNFYNNNDDNVSGRNLTELFNNCVEKLKQENQCCLPNNMLEYIVNFVVRGAKSSCIQQIVQNMQKNRFILSNKDQLFYFDKKQNKWKFEDGINIGLNDIKNIICNVLEKVQKILELNNDKTSINLHKKIQEITLKQTENLQYHTYIYLLRLDDHEFDKYGHLIHFLNSTYNLITHQFIQNDCNYFNTLSLKYCLSNDIINQIQPQIQTLNNIIESILPNKSIRTWFLSSIANNLISISKQKPIVFMKGIGSNGKSFLIQLIRNTLGPYCYKGQSTIFQKDTIQDSTKSTGTVGDAISSRICYIEEIASTTINIEKLKELTGGGTIPTRKLHQDFQEQEIKTQFYVACNNVPNFGKHVDQAIKNRIVAVPFDTEFVENPTESYQKQKIDDVVNYAKETVFQQAFMSIILDHKNINIQIPQEITLFTSEIQDDIDPLVDFFENNFQITENQSLFVTRDQFVDLYNSVFQPSNKLKINNGKSPIFKSFEQFLKNRNSYCIKERAWNNINGIHKQYYTYYGLQIK